MTMTGRLSTHTPMMQKNLGNLHLKLGLTMGNTAWLRPETAK